MIALLGFELHLCGRLTLHRLAAIGKCLIVVILTGSVPEANAVGEPIWVVAASAIQTPMLNAFAVAQPAQAVTVVAAVAGVLEGLTVLPGTVVRANDEIARLVGPQIDLAQARRSGALETARAAEEAARTILAADRGLLLQKLATRQTIAADTSTVAARRAEVAAAEADLDTLRRSKSVRSPVAGIVQSVSAADGDTLQAGSVVSTIQPEAGGWLRATFFNADIAALKPGARGSFTPSGGGAPVAVVVRGALGDTRPDGGVPVALTVEGPLAAGAFGTVTLTLPPVPVVTVPTEALILDKGGWWVMVHDAGGDHAVAVVPGPASGYNTVIRSGLRPGEAVVVTGAYLLYHRGIAALYQPPD